MNSKFLERCRDLRLKTFKEIPGLILFYDNKVICYKNGESQGFKSLDLTLYNAYKTIAHSLIYYSMKHKQNYCRLSDVCLNLQKSILVDANANMSMSSDDILNTSIDSLMQKASELYLNEIHKATQSLKKLVFENTWPTPLLVIVSGPSSPRIGHPAMQYFSWLTKQTKTFEELSLHGINLKETVNCYNSESSSEELKSSSRFLYYVENPQNIVNAIEIGLGLYTERTIFSQFKSMNTDILAQVSHDYLVEKCQVLTGIKNHRI